MQSTFSAAIARAPMRPFQYTVAVFALLMLVVEGVDLQSLSLVTPLILAEWGIDRALFGPALAAALFGMGFGSLFGGMLGDRIGRLQALVLACIIFGTATIAAAWTHDVWALTAVRVLGGVGFGAGYPNALALASDWVSDRWRAHTISFLSVGIPVGTAIAAAVTPLLLPGYGWRGTFMIFGACSIVLGVLTLAIVREAPSYLLARGQKDAAQRSAAKVIDPAIELLPEPAPAAATDGRRIGIFHPSNARLNWGMAVSFSASTTVIYGLLNWTPEFLTSSGFTLPQALEASFWQGILSVIGGASAGVATRTFGSRAVTVALAALIFVNIVALGVVVDGLASQPNVAERQTVNLLAGLAAGLVSMIIAVFYIVMAHGYPQSCRSGGIGFILTAGRATAIAMVFSGGWLLNLGGESFVFYFGTLAAVSVLIVCAAFIVDCQVAPAPPKEEDPA